jgi:hypothetical protein
MAPSAASQLQSMPLSASYSVRPHRHSVAGKIVSVEARHAAAIRDLLRPKTGYFAGDDVVNQQGLDVVRAPREVFRLVDPLITTCIDGSDLPNA